MSAPRLTTLIDFVDAGPHGAPLRCAFGTPLARLQAHRLDEVADVLQAAHAHARQGRWCVGFVRYEAAPAFDVAAAVHAGSGALVQFDVHEQVLPWPADEPAVPATLQWQDTLARCDFNGQVARIQRAIADGEYYQLNLTAPLAAPCGDDALTLFHALRRAQPQAYAAFIDAGDVQIASVSPELFFDWRQGRLLARPMKGTAPRGATPADDAAQAAALRASEKERAENLMIVDLIRNDLSRVAEPHSVQVPRLFDVCAWPTVWQMTSDVTALTRAGIGLADVFGALFPCGSVTGAPKLRAMRDIQRLEAGPRGVYCGAIGVLQPGGAATFSVAIRTVEVARGAARCGIGSAITADSVAEAEWREWRHKRAFLERASAPFELLQTLRLAHGEFAAMAPHLQRLQAAAQHFGFAFEADAARRLLQELAQQHAQGPWRVRLLVQRQGQLRAEAFPLPPSHTPVRVQLAAAPIDAPAEFLRFKTTRRTHYERFAPADPALFDTLLFNADGEITEFTRGNVIAELPDGRRVTPPLRCGLLDGVGRALALEAGVQEAVLRVEQLPQLRRLWFINALRGELQAELA